MCLHDTFVECQQEMKFAKIDCGTTALVSLWIGDKLYIANAGDCRAVVCVNETEKRLTVDHKPSLPSEKARILKHKGAFLDLKNRIQGRLSVARALGDFLLTPYVSCEPEVFGPIPFYPHYIGDPTASAPGSTNDSERAHIYNCEQSNLMRSSYKDYGFMIIACDGLWDVVSDRKAVKIVKQYMGPKEAAVALRDRAIKLRSRDNISIVVIFFPGYEAGKYSFSSSTESSNSEECSSSSSEESESGSESSSSGSLSTDSRSESQSHGEGMGAGSQGCFLVSSSGSSSSSVTSDSASEESN
eukprot:TRINITY_DN2532_c0_g2_i2.p1 TRINITY_DN2532_c0_g2~~TRINITY_DN2532_c0_g2_i2.p1  ORF type:complete len:300 (-),score=40.03 TRINITY_DN2532_c0_g2_i2:105-1004(-)